VERVQIVASMNLSGGVGRYPVASLFTALISDISWIQYPTKEELISIIMHILKAFLD